MTYEERGGARRFFLVCFNGDVVTIDDFRFSGFVVASGTRRRISKFKQDDWFVLFDTSSKSFVGHGRFVESAGAVLRCREYLFEYEFAGDVSRKKNTPLDLEEISHSALGTSLSRRLQGWQCRLISRLTRAEFDSLFFRWWGIAEFSRTLPVRYNQTNI